MTGVGILAGQIGGGGFADGDKDTEARFWGPAALTFDSAGNLYVADYNAVRKISTQGTVSTIVGSARQCGEQTGSGTGALLCYPVALAADDAGNVYAADYAGTTVWRIDATGSMTAYSTSFSCINSLAWLSTTKQLYVGDSCATAGVIKTLDTSVPGAPVLFANTPGPIAGLSFDAAGNVYVASDTTIQVVSAAGTAVSTLAGTLGVPGSADGQGAAAQFGCVNFPYGADYTGYVGAVGIATLPSGTSYIADYCHSTIREATATGNVTTFAGATDVTGSTDQTGVNARFFIPAGVVADAGGNNLYVADYYNGTIRKVSTITGAVSTYAGQEPHSGYIDGAVAQAAFKYPFGIVADSAGNLYLSDTYNYVIRKITPAGVVSTVAGTAGVSGYLDATGTAAKFALPQGIAIDAGGNLYVADNLNRDVRMITPEGVVSTLAQGLLEPSGVAVDAAGNVYVTDHHGVSEFDVTTHTLSKIPLTNATAIVVSADGTLYVTASTSLTSGAVYAKAPTASAFTVLAGGFSYRLPGLILGGDGNLYVSDLNNSVIKQVTPSGTVTTVAGVPDLPMGTAPGGLPAKINAPSGLALLGSGPSVSLAVVDSAEDAILRVILP